MFDEIQRDMLGSVPLATIMRKAKVLAYQLKTPEFKQWVDHELDGYRTASKDQLPAYRKIPTESFGTFANVAWQWNNVQIPAYLLPEDVWDEAVHLAMYQGVRELEAMLETMDSRSTDQLQTRWPSDVAASLSNKVIQRAYCVAAWRVISRSSIAQILDTVRTKLLSFILELMERFPELTQAADVPSNGISQEQVRYIFNTYVMGGTQHVIGPSNIVAEGTMAVFDQKHQKVNYQYNAAGDINIAAVQNSADFVSQLQQLKAALARAGDAEVIDAEVVTDADYQLTKAMQQAQKPQPNKNVIVEHLEQAKDLVTGVSTLVALGEAIVKAIELAKQLF